MTLPIEIEAELQALLEERMGLSREYNLYTNLAVDNANDLELYNKYVEALKGLEGKTQINKDRLRAIKKEYGLTNI